MSTLLSTNSAERKNTPIYSGVLAYFPRAMGYLAQLSKAGNDKHNPGQPLHWAKEKSNDHADCVARHLIEHGTVDPDDGFRHSGKLAWRALALLETELERESTVEGLMQHVRDSLAKASLSYVGAPTVSEITISLDKLIGVVPHGFSAWDVAATTDLPIIEEPIVLAPGSEFRGAPHLDQPEPAPAAEPINETGPIGEVLPETVASNTHRPPHRGYPGALPEPEPFKITAPGVYRLRDGRTAEVCGKSGGEVYPWFGVTLYDGIECSWTDDGTFFVGRDSTDDIVAAIG